MRALDWECGGEVRERRRGHDRNREEVKGMRREMEKVTW